MECHITQRGQELEDKGVQETLCPLSPLLSRLERKRLLIQSGLCRIVVKGL